MNSKKPFCLGVETSLRSSSILFSFFVLLFCIEQTLLLCRSGTRAQYLEFDNCELFGYQASITYLKLVYELYRQLSGVAPIVAHI